MPEPQIGNNIEFIDSIINNSMNWITGVEKEVVDFIVENKQVYFSYSGMGIIPASIGSTIMEVITQENIYPAYTSTFISLHIIPYKEDRYGIIHFTTSPWERNETARLADAVYIMGIPTKFVYPEINDPVLESKIPENMAVSYPGKIDPIILTSLFSAYIGIRAAVKLSSRNDMRVKRLLEDTGSYSGIVSSIKKTYRKEIEELKNSIKSQKEMTILSTTTMLPAGMAMAHYLSNKGYYIRIFDITSGLSLLHKNQSGNNKITVLYTSTEEDSYKDFLLLSLRTGVKPIRIEFKTDPLSAPVYGILLSKILDIYIDMEQN